MEIIYEMSNSYYVEIIDFMMNLNMITLGTKV